jgi:predicted nuclease of predicted toxin-antitoxin system
VKILLDENLDWRLRRELSGHVVESVPLIGWTGLKNSELLEHARGEFDVLIIMDAGLSFQQDLIKYQIAVVVLKAPSNRLADTRLLMSRVIALPPTLKPGTLTIVSA